MITAHRYIKVDILFVRKFLAWFLLILGLLLVPLAVFSFWLRFTILDTNQFIKTVGPLNENPFIAKTVADKLATSFFENVNTEGEIRSSLPEKAQFLAPALNTELKVFISDQTKNLIMTKEFNVLWVGTLKIVHPRLVGLLTGENKLQINDQGKVVLDFSSTVETINKGLQKKGIYIFTNAKINPQIAFFESEKLSYIKHVFNVINFWGWFLPILTLICLAGALISSIKRLRFLFWSGLGLTIMMIVLLAVVFFCQPHFVYMSGDLSKEAGEALYAVIMKPLINMTIFLIVLGVVVSIISFLLPRTRFFRHKFGT